MFVTGIIFNSHLDATRCGEMDPGEMDHSQLWHSKKNNKVNIVVINNKSYLI